MTDQEKQLIEGLASRIHNAPAPEIDREADALIRNGIGNRPDALYIFTQTVLVQEMALNQAKAQIEELNKKLQERSSQSSFLGTPAPSQSAPPHSGQPSWWGGQSAAQPPAAPPPPLPPQQAAQPYYQQQAPPPPPPPASGGMFSGFLRNAATTAAGVVAGEVAFSALSGIFGHHSGGGFMGGDSGFLGGASGVSPGSETIINNYYDSPAGQSGGSEHSGTGSQFVDPGTDDDTDTASANAASDDSYDDTTDDTTEDTSSDDSSDDSYDDSGSYDDGGGNDDI
jgi:hypothetical protein